MYQAKKLLHNEKNNQQNEKIAYELRGGIFVNHLIE